MIDQLVFEKAFARFQELIAAKSGRPFTGFHEGLTYQWESYKPRLRDHALGLLRADEWSRDDIGSGLILGCMIDAIEIPEGRGHPQNNLVFWQNRFGHESREHRTLLEAVPKPKLRREFEALLYALLQGGNDERACFEELGDLSGRKYPLLAYMFFLKDINRFMPINPTGFDRAFDALGLDFITLGQCSWDNYLAFNQVLADLSPLIAKAANLANVSLVDAHSFCWIFSALLKLEAKGELAGASGKRDDGRYLGARTKSIIEMCLTVENTVWNANGQKVERVLKNKELRMTRTALEALIAELLSQQNDRCALTGIPLQFRGTEADLNLLPSLDRKDNSGHYEEGNLQVVCRFINFWKSDANNEEFLHLLRLVRGDEEL